MCRWEIQSHTGLFYRKVTCTRCDVPWFIERMDFSVELTWEQVLSVAMNQKLYRSPVQLPSLF